MAVFPVMNHNAAVFLPADEAGRYGAVFFPPGVVFPVQNNAAAGDAFGKGLLHDGTNR